MAWGRDIDRIKRKGWVFKLNVDKGVEVRTFPIFIIMDFDG